MGYRYMYWYAQSHTNMHINDIFIASVHYIHEHISLLAGVQKLPI